MTNENEEIEETKDASLNEMHWAELSEIEEVYEEDEFRFEPKTGDCLEQYNERRVYQAEMSSNNRMQLNQITQSQEKLLQIKAKESKKMNNLNTTQQHIAAKAADTTLASSLINSSTRDILDETIEIPSAAAVKPPTAANANLNTSTLTAPVAQTSSNLLNISEEVE